MTLLSTDRLKRPAPGKALGLTGVAIAQRSNNDPADVQKFSRINGGNVAQPTTTTRVAGFDFAAGQFKDAKPHKSAFKGGPIQTSQLRDMAENKKRLEVSAAKKAAQVAAAAEGKKPKGKRGRKAK